MKQVLIEKILKNKELPKTMLEVYRSLGYINYKFGYSNSQTTKFMQIYEMLRNFPNKLRKHQNVNI